MATYHIQVFGSQTRLNRPQLSHTYATFIERTAGGDRPFTISWLPEDLDIDPFGLAERGKNFTYDETIEWLDDAGSDIRWESEVTAIKPALFRSAVVRFEQLEAAKLKYKMIDSFLTRPNRVSNCIHAVSDIPLVVDKLGKAFTGTLRGISASRFVYHYLSPFYLEVPRISAREEASIEELQRESMHVAVIGTAREVKNRKSGK